MLNEPVPSMQLLRAVQATPEYKLNQDLYRLVAETAKNVRTAHASIENYMGNLRLLVEQSNPAPSLRKTEANTKVIHASIARSIAELQRLTNSKVEGNNAGTLMHPTLNIVAPRIKQLLSQACSQLDKVRFPGKRHCEAHMHAKGPARCVCMTAMQTLLCLNSV